MRFDRLTLRGLKRFWRLCCAHSFHPNFPNLVLWGSSMNSWKIFINFFSNISHIMEIFRGVIFFCENIFFSKCISSGVFQYFSQILQWTVRGQLTLTKLYDENQITCFSLPPGAKILKRGPCFDILAPGGKEKWVIAFSFYK